MRLYKTPQGWTGDPLNLPLLAPIDAQRVWAAGVICCRSRAARMADSELAGSGSFYDRAYTAARPELFFKALAHRVAGPAEHVRIRRDSKWNVPEPELALVISPEGKITGYTIGNDMSSRDCWWCCRFSTATWKADGPTTGRSWMAVPNAPISVTFKAHPTARCTSAIARRAIPASFVMRAQRRLR